MKIKLLLGALLLSFAAVAVPVKTCGKGFAVGVIKPLVESGELPGAIAVFCKGEAMDVSCVGWANVEKKLPIAMDQFFMQCSQTKGFCGVTIAMLIEEGKISLDDPVSKYLPEFKTLKVKKNGKIVPAKNTLTIRMVMNHTGGFPFEIPSKIKKGWPGVSLRETAREAAGQPLLFEPGTKMKYSNTGIDIGAAVIEVVTGKGWDVFLKERVLDPLGMKDTTFNPSDEQLARSISMYNVAPGKKAEFKLYNNWMPLPHNGPGVYPSAGAGLWTTTRDQLKFYRMLMNLGKGDNGVRILKESTVKELLARNSRPAGLGKYSLGLNVSDEGHMSHGGAWHTSCSVNWKTRQLFLKVVQFNGRFPEFNRKLWNAAERFFQSKVDTSGDAYTGRLQ